jgi:cobalt-zinc-cadmium resistance protein CzcA
VIRAIIRFSFEYRWAVFAAWTVLVVAGVRAFVALPVEPFPDPDDVHVNVITQFPGKAPEEVETLVTSPLERAINGTPGLTRIRSTSMFGLSVIYTTFDEETTDTFARQQVFERISQVTLPPGVTPSLGPLSDSTGEIFRYTVSAPGVNILEIRAIQDWKIVPVLRAVQGVADVNAFGGGSKEYVVHVDPILLRAHDVTLQQVFQALAAGNANGGGSVVVRGQQELTVRSVGLLRDAKDAGDVVIASRNGTPVTVRQVATIERGTPPRRGFVAKDGADDVVMGIVLLRKGSNAMAVTDAVRARIAKLNAGELPLGVKIVPCYDRSHLVWGTLKTVLENTAEGLLLVALVLVVFMGDLRASLIVVLTVPLAVLFAFLVLQATGQTLNLLSLGAVDFGVVVNGAVIVVEGMLVRLMTLEEGDDRPKRLEEVVQELGPPIFFATLIIITLNVPILSFQRVEGRIFRPLALTVGLAILGALMLTLTLVPQLAAVLIRKGGTKKSWYMARLEWLYLCAVTYALRYRVAVLGSAALAFVGSLWLARDMGTEFLPKLDEGNIWLTCTLPLSVSAPESKRIEGQLRTILRGYTEVRLVITQLGRPEDGTDPKGVNNIEILADLKPREEWPARKDGRAWWKDELVEDMKEKLSVVPGVEYRFSQYIQDNVEEALSGVKGEVAVKIFGTDLAKLQALAEKVRATIEKIPGADDVASERVSGLPQLDVAIDRERASRAGVNVQDIQQAIEVGVGGSPATTIVESNRKFDLAVRLERDARDGSERISEILVPTPDGGSIPIGDIATLRIEAGAAEIKRESNERRVAVKCGIRGRDLGGFIREAMEAVDREVVKNPAVWPRDGYTLTWEGEFENQQRAMRRLGIIVPACVVIVVGLLFWTFRSLKTAMLIMITVPLGLMGGLLGLLGAGIYVSISAAIGFITLGGIAVENGVILVARIHTLRAHDGLEIDVAIIRGCVERLRAVLMAALTAALGFVPAVASHGMGAEVRKPLAVVVVFGTLSACSFTLFVLPCLYRLVERGPVKAPSGASH